MVVGTKCPVIDGLKFLKGSPIVPGKHENVVLVLEFWATWCGPCVQSIPVGVSANADVRASACGGAHAASVHPHEFSHFRILRQSCLQTFSWRIDACIQSAQLAFDPY